MGKLILYSLFSGVNVDLEELENKAEQFDVDMDLLPVSTPVNIKRIRLMLKKTFHSCFGIDIRENGGVVFIPSQYLSEWNKVKELLLSVGAVEIDEVDVGVSNANLIFKKLDKKLKDFFCKEGPSFLDERGKFKLPRTRIDLMYCTQLRIVYYLELHKVYSEILGNKSVYNDKINSLYDAIKKAIEIRTEEIEEERLYGY